MSDERKERLLLESSQPSPPSSKTSFQRTLLNLTASTVASIAHSYMTVEASLCVLVTGPRRVHDAHGRHDWIPSLGATMANMRELVTCLLRWRYLALVTMVILGKRWPPGPRGDGLILAG